MFNKVKVVFVDLEAISFIIFYGLAKFLVPVTFKAFSLNGLIVKKLN